MNNNYLCHHGILGMKWGVRRYQNEDGSLTEAGKRRYAIPSSAIDGMKRASASAKQLTTAANTLNNIKKGSSNRYDKRPVLTQDEMDNMSNADLQSLVTRLNLETQYSNLTASHVQPDLSKRIATGAQYVAATLSVAAALASIIPKKN